MIYRETEEITKEERKNVFDKLLAYNLSHLEDKTQGNWEFFWKMRKETVRAG